jgi:hypothetical protein
MTLAAQMEQHGFGAVSRLLTAAEVREFIETLGDVAGAGRRGLLAVRRVADLARSDRLTEWVHPLVPGKPRPVRAIFFDKSPHSNWLVSWHQDLTIAVGAKADVAGFGPWSVKDSVPHVQPPVEILERMITVRLHLEDCDEDNGALRVLPGTHCLGRLTPEQIGELRRDGQEMICRAAAGDALLMRPLLLHASSRSRTDRHRRVLHVEYAGCELPEPLEWHDAN